ncbi:phosphoribosyltransferase [Micropruina sp.]|uniref:phosphoribosyltransferase n=1 Tax=Micropruina sp. TaxID=2737536 RepID=UPI0039E2646F
MNDPTPIDPTALLQGLAGTYLRNPRRTTGACAACCGGVNPEYMLCYPCEAFRQQGRLSNAAGFCIYAAQGTQAGQLMYGYKAPYPAREHVVVMSLLLQLALNNHAQCPSRLVGQRVTHWAAVPSTRGRIAPHPLRGMVAAIRPEPEVVLTHVEGVQPVRQRVVPGLFRSGASLADGSHVLLVDDTWASGGTPLSAVHALREAGASWVSIIAVARWLSFDFMRAPTSGPTLDLHRSLLSQVVYDLSACPFTGSVCP